MHDAVQAPLLQSPHELDLPGGACNRPASRVVLDTNIWLDWLVFDDPSTRWLAAGWQTGKLTVHASESMRAEFADVITRPQLGLGAARAAALLARFDRIVTTPATGPARRAALPTAQAAATFAAHCTDPDDRKFVAFALERGAHYLYSRDRAVLRLARRAVREHGLVIARLTDAAPPGSPCAAGS